MSAKTRKKRQKGTAKRAAQLRIDRRCPLSPGGVRSPYL